MQQPNMREIVESKLTDTEGLDASTVPAMIGLPEGTLPDRLRASRWLIFDADEHSFGQAMSALEPLMQDGDARAAYENLLVLRAGVLAATTARKRAVLSRRFNAAAGETLGSWLIREAITKTFESMGLPNTEVAFVTLGDGDTCGQCEIGQHDHDAADGHCHNVHPLLGQHCACEWRAAKPTKALVN